MPTANQTDVQYGIVLTHENCCQSLISLFVFNANLTLLNWSLINQSISQSINQSNLTL